MKDLTPLFKAHIRQGVTTLATCMEIVRHDGKSFRFTDHDVPITVNNAIYIPYSSFARTSVTTSIDLEVDLMEVRGALNALHVSRDDVASGLFDFAQVKVFVVNYEAPDTGSATLRTGWLGEVTMNEDGTYAAELRGLSQVFAYRIGEAYSPECRADLGDRRCKLPIAPSRWVANIAYPKGAVVVGNVNTPSSYLNLELTNAGFDTDGFEALTTNVTGWTFYGDPRGRWSLRTSIWNGTTPYSGYSAFGTDDGNDQDPPNHTVAQVGMYQDVDIEAQGADSVAVDTGTCRLFAAVMCASVNGTHGAGQFRVYALDADGVQIGAAAIFDSGGRKGAEDKWFQIAGNDILIPAGTRKLRFDVLGNKRAQDESGTAFDSVTAVLNYPGGTFASAQQNGGVAFQANNAGISGTTEPGWNTTLGGTTTDNTIIWTAIRNFSVTSHVDGVLAGGKIIVPAYLFDIAGYYDGGLLTWETGLNAGRSQEIKSWVPGQLTLFQRPFTIPQIGDRFVVRPGCDKTRTTCSTKFANILNFRGEPDVPGQDTYYSTPNAPEQ
jgi:hypothetical protein